MGDIGSTTDYHSLWGGSFYTLFILKSLKEVYNNTPFPSLQQHPGKQVVLTKFWKNYNWPKVTKQASCAEVENQIQFPRSTTRNH